MHKGEESIFSIKITPVEIELIFRKRRKFLSKCSKYLSKQLREYDIGENNVCCGKTPAFLRIRSMIDDH